MGSSSRPKPAYLAEKLLTIRLALGLSQNEMLERLGEDEDLFRSSISAYERGMREPPLPILLKYSRVANVFIEVLIGDELELPKKLPTSPKSEGIRWKKASNKQSR
jgi:transcriptional regulator with XRE-family HTH domain